MINARFDVVMRLSTKDMDHTGFVFALIPQAPAVGEIINLRGNPYIILERRWALEEKTGELWVYFRCLCAFTKSDTKEED